MKLASELKVRVGCLIAMIVAAFHIGDQKFEVNQKFSANERTVYESAPGFNKTEAEPPIF
jgi:hypothetical protein